jgi:hypothetical protein
MSRLANKQVRWQRPRVEWYRLEAPAQGRAEEEQTSAVRVPSTSKTATEPPRYAICSGGFSSLASEVCSLLDMMRVP